MIGPRFPGGAREAFVHPELIHTVLRMPSAPCHAPVPGVGICCRLPTSGESEGRILSEQILQLAPEREVLALALRPQWSPAGGNMARVRMQRLSQAFVVGKRTEKRTGVGLWEDNLDNLGTELNSARWPLFMNV